MRVSSIRRSERAMRLIAVAVTDTPIAEDQHLPENLTLVGICGLRDELREWQAGFWGEALALASKDTDGAYVFGDAGVHTRSAYEAQPFPPARTKR